MNHVVSFELLIAASLVLGTIVATTTAALLTAKTAYAPAAVRSAHNASS